MERETLRRTSARIALANHQKPRRTISELRNPFGEEFNRHAWPVTHAFLRAAVEEGAHLIVPKVLGKFPDGEARWIRKRNIAGIYFGSKASKEDIGRMFGYSRNSTSNEPNLRSGPQEHIKTFIKLLWGNCSEELQRAFPLNKIPTDKPLTNGNGYRSSTGVSNTVDGVFTEAFPLIVKGKLTKKGKVIVVNGTTNPIQTIILNRRRRGLLPESKGFLYRSLAKRFENVPKDSGLRQLLLFEADLNFYKNYRHFFVTPSECLSRAGLGIRANRRIAWIESALKKAHVPIAPLVGVLRVRGKEYLITRLAILKYDQVSAVQALTEVSR